MKSMTYQRWAMVAALFLILALGTMMGACDDPEGATSSGTPSGQSSVAATAGGSEDGTPDAGTSATDSSAESSSGTTVPSAQGEGGADQGVSDQGPSASSTAPQGDSGQSASGGGTSGQAGTGTSAVPTTDPGATAQGLTGVVRDFDTGDPLAGVEVEAGGVTAKTNTDGSYTLSGALQQGDEVNASKGGYFGARSLVRGEQRDGFWVCDIELVATDSPNAPPPPPGS